MTNLETNDKVGQKPSKALESRSFDPQLGAWIVSWNYEVDNGHALSTFTYGLLEQKIENERNVARARITVDNSTFVALTNRTRNQAANILREFAVSEVEVRETLATTAFPTLEFLSLEATSQAVNPAHNLWKITTATAWIPLTRKYTDEELGLALTETRTVVDLLDGGYALPVNTAGAFYEEVKVDTRRAIRTTTTIDSYHASSNPNPGKVTYKDDQYSFPALLAKHTHPSTYVVAEALEYNSRLEEANKRSVFWVNVNVREAFTAPVMMKIVEEILTPAQVTTLLGVGANNTTAYGANAGFYSAPTGDLGTDVLRARLFVPRPRDINYNGLLFNLQIPNVLTDGYQDLSGGGGADGRITATTQSGDTYYGYPVEDILTVLPSFPTATAYIALIGSAVCIEDSISMWKFGAFKRTRVIIVLQ